MKSFLKPTSVLAAFVILGLSAQAGQTSTIRRAPAAPAKTMALPPAPSVVSTRTPLSSAELAKYQQKDANYQATAAAGSDDSESWWIIGGAVVVVGIVIIVASGGHGGSGGGGY